MTEEGRRLLAAATMKGGRRLLRVVIWAAWLFFGLAELCWLLGAPGDVQLPLYRIAAGFFAGWLFLRQASRDSPPDPLE